MDRGAIKIRTCVRYFTILLEPLRVWRLFLTLSSLKTAWLLR